MSREAGREELHAISVRRYSHRTIHLPDDTRRPLLKFFERQSARYPPDIFLAGLSSRQCKLHNSLPPLFTGPGGAIEVSQFVRR
jgi:hypothetical protein